jgi:hypothetical protein
MAEWFYVQNGSQHGPLSLEVLQQLAVSGEVKAADMVWTTGMATWQPAAQTAGLFPPSAAPPQLPAVPIGYASPAGYGQPQRSIGDDAGTRWLLPVGRSGWAIAAGYLGLLSFVLVPAPLALICSIIAIRDIRRHPNRHGMGRAVFGLIMGILGTIALAFMIVAMVSGQPHRNRF